MEITLETIYQRLLDTKSELRAEMKADKDELKTDIKELKADIKELKVEVDSVKTWFIQPVVIDDPGRHRHYHHGGDDATELTCGHWPRRDDMTPRLRGVFTFVPGADPTSGTKIRTSDRCRPRGGGNS